MESKLKILIATGLYPPEVGGPATYSKTLYEELPKRGFAVDVLPFSEVRYLPKIARHFLYFLKCLKRGYAADIIYAQDPVSVGLPVMLAAKFLRKKFLLKVVGDYAWEQYQQKKELRIKNKELRFVTPDEFQNKRFDWLTELRRKIERSVSARADKIIVPSEYLKKIVTMWGVPDNKITVVYNSFEFSDVRRPTKEEVRQSLGILTDKKVIFSAGRLVPWKGFDTLIEIMPDILAKVPEAQLIIAGDGPEREALELRIKNYELGSKIKLLGNISRTEVWNYLTGADVFALNTGYEGLSHQILEAMAASIAIVTTDVCGNPELVENDKNALLVKYNDRAQLTEAIVRILTDDALRNRLIAASLSKEYSIERFNKENMMNGLIKVLRYL
jgi:glycosyltransferase involved in cell wall biosynthesis